MRNYRVTNDNSKWNERGNNVGSIPTLTPRIIEGGEERMKIRVHFTNGETKDINTNVPFDSIAKSIDNANSNAKWLVFSKILVLIDNVNYIEPLEENQP